MRFQSILSLLFVLLFSISLVAKDKIDRTDVYGLHFDKGIKNARIEFMAQDLKWLDELVITKQDAELQAVLGLEKINSEILMKWLRARVTFIIGEKVNVAKSSLWHIITSAIFPGPQKLNKWVYIADEHYNYENPGIIPDLPGLEALLAEDKGGIIVMANIGAALYLMGKYTNYLIGFRLQDKTRLPVTSPRAGIIQIGEGLFHKRFIVNSENLESVANSIGRLGTFFHEARHSDGNAKTLGFLHSECPADHDLEGYPACDNNLNGPYTVGALVERQLVETCSACTEKEKETLRLAYLDSFNRVIKPSENWDAEPEGL